MDGRSDSVGTDVNILKLKIHDLERQLAEANAAIQTLTEEQKGEGINQTEQQKAETELDQDRARVQAILNSLTEGVVIFDLEGNVLDVNPAGLRITGYASVEESQRHLVEFPNTLEVFSWDGKVLPVGDWPLARVLNGETFTGLEFEVHRKDTGRIWIGSYSGTLVRNAAGEPIFGVLTLRDVTERKRAEEGLRRSEAVLAQAGKMAQFGAWDIEFSNYEDFNANPLRWSDEVYRILGYKPGEVEVTNELFFERVHPEDRQRIHDAIARALAEKRSYEIEHRIIRPDGSERVVHELANIEFDDLGRPLRIIGAVQDITDRKRAEETLRASEARFRQLADSMPQLVWTAGPDGRVDYYNQRYKEYHGLAPADGGVWQWSPVLHFEDMQPTLDAWTKSVKTGETYQIEHRVRMADGSYRWHLSRGVPVLNGRGQIERWYGTATDIDDLKHAEESLKRALAQAEEGRLLLEAVMDSIPDGVTITGGPPDFPIRKVSRYGMELTGRPTLDLVGIPAGQHQAAWGVFLPDRVTHPSPEQMPLYRACRYGEEVHGMELVLQTQDGRFIPLLVSAAPIRDSQGQIVSAINVWHDITERIRAEEALRNQNERLALLSDAAGELLQSIDPVSLLDRLFQRLAVLLGLEVYVHYRLSEDGTFLRLGALSGFPAKVRKQLEKLELGQAVCGTAAVAQQRMVVEDVQQSSDERTELIRALGLSAYVCYPLIARGKLIGTLSFGTRSRTHFDPAALDLLQAASNLVATAILRNQDELALQVYTQQLEGSNRDLQEFAFVASHDLQEPLRKIEAFGDALLQKSDNLDERQRDHLDRMRKASERMRSMVDGLLQLSRLSTQARPFELVDLSQVAADVLSDLELNIRRSGGKVELGELPQVEADPLQMRQLFQNLIGNALKFHRPGVPPVARVWSRPLAADRGPLTTGSLPDQFEIIIEDNGIGFDEEHSGRLFQPFQRLVGRSEYEGSGMGLAICRRIIEHHGGEIIPQSKKGQGTRFIVTLPAGHTQQKIEGFDEEHR